MHDAEAIERAAEQACEAVWGPKWAGDGYGDAHRRLRLAAALAQIQAMVASRPKAMLNPALAAMALRDSFGVPDVKYAPICEACTRSVALFETVTTREYRCGACGAGLHVRRLAWCGELVRAGLA